VAVTVLKEEDDPYEKEDDVGNGPRPMRRACVRSPHSRMQRARYRSSPARVVDLAMLPRLWLPPFSENLGGAPWP
jgi:hypothetical protein